MFYFVIFVASVFYFKYFVKGNERLSYCCKSDEKSANGCAICLVQNGKSSLLFAESKVAPMIQKSLLKLELLAVYLALKCLKSLFELICHLKIKNIL